MTDKFSFYAEHYGNSYKNELNKMDCLTYGNVGVAYLLKDRIQLDAKVAVDFNTFDNYFVGAGISFRAFN